MLGVDPHKQSHTATALVTGSHQQLATLRVPASPSGYRQLLGWARQFPQRRWAIENARGLGCHLTQWLLARGETVQDVRTTATARVRELSRGRGRKTDALDAAAAAAAAPLQATPPSHSQRPPRSCWRGCWIAGGHDRQPDPGHCRGPWAAGCPRPLASARSSPAGCSAAPDGRRGSPRRRTWPATPARLPSRGPAASALGTACPALVTGSATMRCTSSPWSRSAPRGCAGDPYFRRKLAEGKTTREAMRCLRRRVADHVWRVMLSDEQARNHRQPQAA
jgi:hypothetical protein